MKKTALFITAVVAMGLTACMWTLDVAYDQGTELTGDMICFRSDARTRAFTETTTENLKGKGFNACILIGTTLYVSQSKATWSPTRSVYIFTPPYYYPSSGTLNFYACEPSDLTVDSDVVTIEFAHSSAGYETDLIAASTSATMPKTGSVGLAFDHVLAQVSTTFKAGDSSVNYYLKACSITSPGYGTYGFGTNAWTPGYDSAHQTYSSAAGTQVTTSGSDLGDVVTCIPCTLRVDVEWECRTSGGTLLATYAKTGDVNVVMGYRNAVTVTLTNDDSAELLVSAVVNPWLDKAASDLEWRTTSL